MLAMDWIRTTVALAALVVFLRWTGLLRINKSKRLPPGPREFPILGHLHLLGKHPPHNLYQLAKKHGPIMHMCFGFVPCIIVSSPQAAEQFLKTNDLVFASRPAHEGSKYMSYGQKNMVFSQYGPYWRNMRKLSTLELLSNLKINSFQPMRREELGLLVKSIEEAAKDHVAVDLSAKLSSMSADMSCRMVFGKKYSDKDLTYKGFQAVIQDSMQLSAAPNLGDYFPYIGVLDLQGLTRRMKANAKIFDEFFEKIIDEHVQFGDQGQTKDFVDTMMANLSRGETEIQLDRGHVKAMMLDMLLASTDTSATAIEWVLSELFKHPQVLKKVQKEVEQVVGLERMVEESDLDKLQFLDMVIKEAFRLHPVGPLLIPHESIEDCTVDGFHIPKKSRVIVNVWAIGRDPNVWPDPEKFIPERFIGSKIDLRGHDFQLIPFGSGRRSCPGMQLGLTVVRLVVAQLVHCFDWELPNGTLPTELDMTEKFGLVMYRANHLMAIPTYRLRKQ